MKALQRQFTIEGLNVERLIRQAGEEGIALMGLRRMKGRKLRGAIAENDIPRLQHLSEQGGWRLTLGHRVGAGRFVDLFHKRLILVILCSCALMVTICASRMMWQIDIRNGGIYEADIRKYLEESDLRPICWKKSVDTAALRDALEWRYPNIAWVEVGWRGMTLQINVVTGTAAGEAASINGSGDVVASRDGVVVSVVTVAGTPMVEVGDIVREGQVLITGEERTTEDARRPVAARGQVLARVWDGAAVQMSTLERETVYSGRTQQAYVATLPWFYLWKAEPSGYAQEDVAVRTMPLGGLFIPATIRYETRMEASVILQQRNLEEVKAEAGVAALRKLRQKIGVDDDLVDKWVDYSMIDGEILGAVAFGERVIDIARTVRKDVQ